MFECSNQGSGEKQKLKHKNKVRTETSKGPEGAQLRKQGDDENQEHGNVAGKA